MCEPQGFNNSMPDKPKSQEGEKYNRKEGLKLSIPDLNNLSMSIDDSTYTDFFPLMGEGGENRDDITGKLFMQTNNNSMNQQEYPSKQMPNHYSGFENDVLFSPTSSSSQKNVVTPTLKIECHEDAWQDMLSTSNMNVQDLKDTSNHEEKQYLSAFTPTRYNSESYKSDTESDYGSIYHTPNLNPTDPAISPAMSYLTTGDDEIDDLLSVHSDVSAISNISNALNSGGYKHVTNLDDLDHLLSITSGNFTELDGFIQTPLQGEFPDHQFTSPPVISVQEFQEQEQRNNRYIDQSVIISSAPNFPIPFESQDEAQNKILLQPETTHDERRHGRITKRRTSSVTGCSARSRSTNRSLSRSASPDEKARALSSDKERLLELANLHTPNPMEFPQDIQNKSSLSSPLADNETLQNFSTEAKKKMGQKITAAYACELCGKKFTRPYNLKSHLRTHTNEKPFICSICGKAFARQHDKKRHEDLHTGKKRYLCGGKLKDGTPWGCGKKFARSDALGRHFKTESGRKCIAPLYAEASREKKIQNESTE